MSVTQLFGRWQQQDKESMVSFGYTAISKSVPSAPWELVPERENVSLFPRAPVLRIWFKFLKSSLKGLSFSPMAFPNNFSMEKSQNFLKIFHSSPNLPPKYLITNGTTTTRKINESRAKPALLSAAKTRNISWSHRVGNQIQSSRKCYLHLKFYQHNTKS